MLIKKNNGDMVPFEAEKLRTSLKRSGAADDIIEEVVGEISSLLFEGMTTKKIYRKAFQLLNRYSHSTAGRYKLKQALIELGPSGYPFEQFVSELLKLRGYSTLTNQNIGGKCISHEVDILAKKDDERYLVECKFHNTTERYCDVKVPMYIRSRFEDIQQVWNQKHGKDGILKEGWIYTNTRFTSDAVSYGKCAGLKLISWDYPIGSSLRESVDRAGLHPVTSISSLTKNEKQSLIDAGAIHCKRVIDHPEILDAAGINPRKQNKIIKEAKALYQTKNHS